MNIPSRRCVGFQGVAGVLPPTRLTLEQLSARRMIVSSPADLASFGFRAVHVADAAHDTAWLVAEAARRALDDARLRPDDIGLLIWTSALAQNHLRAGGSTKRSAPSASGAAGCLFRTGNR